MSENINGNANDRINGNVGEHINGNVGEHPDWDVADWSAHYAILEDDKVSIDDKMACLLSMKPDLTMSKDELEAILSDKANLQDFIGYIRGLENLHQDFECMMSSIRQKLNDFNTLHPMQLTTMGLYHIEGNPYTKEKGMGETFHCMTNIFSNVTSDNEQEAEKERAKIVNILFQNCKMSRAFRDIIVGTYLCLKKADIADGIYATDGERVTSAPPSKRKKPAPRKQTK